MILDCQAPCPVDGVESFTHRPGRVRLSDANDFRRVSGRTAEGAVAAQVEQGGDTQEAVALCAVCLDDRADFCGQVVNGSG